MFDVFILEKNSLVIFKSREKIIKIINLKREKNWETKGKPKGKPKKGN